MAWDRLTRNWNSSMDEIRVYYLDLLNYRTVSAQIANEFNVIHESPQALLIRNEKCLWFTSHQDISVDAIQNAIRNAEPGITN
jgi:bacillithiol system protein YtxJ